MRNLTPDLAIARDGDIHVMLRNPPAENSAAFIDAARVAQKIEHPNVVRVLEVGDDGYASEYFHAEDARTILETVVKNKAQLPIQHAIAIAIGAATGLHAAHEMRAGTDKKAGGILHRDLSPSNILVARDGTVKLVDFEIARAIGAKPAYMSPEAVRDQPVDRRSDVYVLGIVLYELATTSRLFRGDLATIKDAITTGKVPLPRVRRPDIPNELGMIIMRALATDPARRFQTAEEMRATLEQFARAADLLPTPRQLGDYVKKTCGDRLEPWRVEGFSTGSGAASGPPSSPSSPSISVTPVPGRSSANKGSSWLESSARRGGGGDSDANITPGGGKRGSRPSGKFTGPPGESTGSFSRMAAQSGSSPNLRDSRPSRPSTQMIDRGSASRIPMATDWDTPSKATAAPGKGGGSFVGKLAIPLLVVVVLGLIGLVVLFVMSGDKKSGAGDGSGSAKSDRANVAPTIAADPTQPTPVKVAPGSGGGGGGTPPAPGSASGATPTTDPNPRTGGGGGNTTTQKPKDGSAGGGGGQDTVVSGGSATAPDVTPDAAPAVANTPTVDAGAGAGGGGDGSGSATTPMVTQLSAATVENVARDHQGELGKCDSSALHGTVSIAFQIDANGKVTASQLTSTAGKATAAVCYLRSLAKWQFPHPPTGAAKGAWSMTFP